MTKKSDVVVPDKKAAMQHKHMAADDIVHRLQNGGMLTMRGSDTPPMSFVAHAIEDIRLSQKFVIDDSAHPDIAAWMRDTTELSATAVAMHDAGRYLTPFPSTLVEWRMPATSMPIKKIVAVAQSSARGVLTGVQGYFYVPAPGQRKPSWHAEYMSTDPHIMQAATLALSKLLILLDADLTVRERVAPEHIRSRAGNGHRRPSGYTNLRAPVEYVGEPGAPRGAGGTRRMHLVRGFMWGRHVRPVEEQRWIKPHWRGDESVGVVKRDHYRSAQAGPAPSVR